jgi:glycosyltransferase involved in cell wall biosynthesis
VVVVNGRCLGRRVTGVERYTRELSRRFADRTRVERPSGAADGAAGHLWEQVTLPQRLASTDLLWSPANTGPLAARRHVVTIHDVSAVDHPEWFHPAFAAWYAYLLPRLGRRARHVITDSEFSRQRIVERLDVPASRVTAIPCGVGDQFRPQPAAAIHTLVTQLGIHKPYVLTVGSLQPRKNLGTVLRAWATLGPAVEDVELAIAGCWRDSFASATLERGRGVRWLGHVDDRALPALYAGATVVLVLSLYEGFGLTALEAMASGVPVIAATGSALDEAVGDDGVRVNPFDVEAVAAALKDLLADATLRQSLRERGFARARRFSWDQTAARTWQVLEASDD